jgi:hypothetical protein
MDLPFRNHFAIPTNADVGALRVEGKSFLRPRKIKCSPILQATNLALIYVVILLASFPS